MIKKSKEKFKVGLLNDTEEFKRAVSNLLQELQIKGPYAANLKPQEAIDIINQFLEQLDNLKSHELELRHGLNLFKIEQPPFKEIAIIEKVIIISLINYNYYFGFKLFILIPLLETIDSLV